MALRGKLGRAFFCSALAIASFGGAAMRPEEIEALMAEMNKPKVVDTLPEDSGAPLNDIVPAPATAK